MKPSIAVVSGTYGTEVQNGVGRFLLGLHQWSCRHHAPLTVFSSGDHIQRYPEVRDMHGLSFAVPGGFSAVRAYYPLEGRRKQFHRTLKLLNPNIVHISTPDALGLCGLHAAQRQKRIIAGIYHTDFPAFVHQVVCQSLERWWENRDPIQTPAITSLLNHVKSGYIQRSSWWERWLLRYLWRRWNKRNHAEMKEWLHQGMDRIAQLASDSVRWMLQQFYRSFDVVIARSETSRLAIEHQLGLNPARLRTLPSGVDTAMFHPVVQPSELDLRTRLGLIPGHRVVLYVGRVTDEKNVRFLAQAWRIFQARSKVPTQFVVVGSGLLTDFQEQAGPGVLMLGPRHGAELSAIYRAADVFWTASPHETLGQVVLEALASGLPVIAPDQGAAGENVHDGESGLILPLDNPERWALSVDQLLQQTPRLTRMKLAARVFAEGRSIEGSYEAFWDLHQDLWENHEQSATPVVSVKPTEADDSPAVSGNRTVHLSDFHAGKRRHRIPKEAALRAACARACRLSSRVMLHGDFLDTRPALHKFREELAMVRRVFEEYSIQPTLYLEGNHDYEFARANQITDLIGCPVARSLVHRDPETGLVVTHGHVSELPELWKQILESKTPDELIERLTVDELKESLHFSAFRYDVVTSMTNMLEHSGISGLEDAWRYTLPMRRGIANWLTGLSRQRREHDFGSQALIHMIGSSDREEALAQLGIALGGWGVIYGHTHEPHLTLQSVVDIRTGHRRNILLGNSGSFCRKSIPPTWIEAEYPAMELWCYDTRTEQARLMQRMELSPADQRAFESSPQAAPQVKDHALT